MTPAMSATRVAAPMSAGTIVTVGTTMAGAVTPMPADANAHPAAVVTVMMRIVVAPMAIVPAMIVVVAGGVVIADVEPDSVMAAVAQADRKPPAPGHGRRGRKPHEYGA